MTELEAVAMWGGLIASVIGSVLAIVAMIFTWVVNKRSDRISDHTIQSLQKIESTVAVLSENTNSLIKAAWEKMLGAVGSPSDQGPTPQVTRELAAGIAAEIREELGLSNDRPSTPAEDERLEKLERALERLEATVQTQAAFKARESRPPELLELLLRRLRHLSPTARAFLTAIEPRHLTASQYRALRDSSLGPAITELRDAGLLAPLVSREPGHPTVYFMPGKLHHALEPANALLPAIPSEVSSLVDRELARVGYDRG